MKRIIYLTIATLVFFGAMSCNDDRAGPMSPNIIWGTGLKFNEETALKKLIVRDVLGFALSTAIDPAVFVGLPEEKTEGGASAITINVSFSSTDSVVAEDYSFVDEEGLESLFITASGGKNEIITQSTDSSMVNFSPLNIVFDFDQFVFTNACGMRAYLDGIMECRVQGKYNRINENFKGSASCRAGLESDPRDLIYVLTDKDEERAVRMTINVSINGNAFQLESYSFSGTVFIDSRMMTVDNNFDDVSICSPLTD